MKIIVLNINQTTIARGTEIFWDNLSSELKKHDADVKIIFSTSAVIQNKSVNLSSKILRRLYLDCYSLHVFWFTLVNLKKIINESPDIIIPTNGGWQIILIRLIRGMGLINKSKIVIIGHAGIGHDDEFNLKHSGADLFVAITKEWQDWGKKVNPKIQVVLIENGVDIELFCPIGEKYEYQLEKPIFITVSSFEKYKNIEKTIEAVGRLPKGSLVILGSGEEERNLQTLCDKKLKGRYMIGKINHQELPRYYRGANVFTLVSGQQEAFGLVYLEALACDLPVVASDDSKRREIIGNAGLFIDPDNAEAYKSALIQAASQNWGNIPRLQAEKFDWKIIGEKYYLYFFQIIK